MIDDPEDYEDDLEDECFHEDYEIDNLTGIASCICGHRWMLTAEDFQRLHEMQVEYDHQMAKWEAEEPEPDVASDREITDDEIPF